MKHLFGSTLPKQIPDEAVEIVMELRANVPIEIDRHAIEPVFTEGTSEGGGLWSQFYLAYERW